MHNLSNIQFFKNGEIDKVRWDETIKLSSNGLIYARSFYLDNMAPGWHALAGENYEWVLPLTNRKKYGISYLYQPAFMQQSGVFSKQEVTIPYKEILLYVQKHYKFCEINWNFATPTYFIKAPLQIETANNFILDLSCSYESITSNYHNDLIKNLKRSKNFQHIYRTTNDYNKCIQLYREHYGQRMPHVKENDYKNFSAICSYAKENDMIVCREVVNEDNTLLAAALLLSDGKRLYNLMNTTTQAGRKTEANHFLLNAVIEEFSGKDVLLDFEGSDLSGVKAFYENFGAVNQPYFRLKYNNLPMPLRLFKK